MSDCSINDVEFNIVYSEEEKNILKVNSKKEIFFEVFECSVFDNDTIVVEQIGLWKDLPLVSVEFIKEDKKYTCEAVLVEDGTTEFIVNEDNLFYLGNKQKEQEEKTNVSENGVNEDIKLEINHTYDEKIKEYEDKKFNFLNELELQFEDKITNLKEDISIKLDAFFEKLEDKKKELIDDEIETITLNLNEKFVSFKKEINELSDFNRDNIDSILENKITDIDDTVKLFLDNLTENYSSKFKNNDKKVTASLIEINSIRNKLKKYYEKSEEKFNDLFKLEEKLVNQDVYSEKNKEIFEFINEELERINNKFIYISEEENKKYNELLATVSKTDVVEYKTILKEKIQDVELNLVKEELKSELSNNFKNEITSLKRYAEMSAGGGTNAVQYANGGTMNGSLNVNGNILSGGRNLDEIFGAGVSGSSSEYLSLSGGSLTGQLSSNNTIIAETILATNILSATNLDIGYELSGFNVTGSISASGNLSANNIYGNGIISNGDLDMNGNSIVNVGSGSITFKDGASIGSLGTGNLSLSSNVGSISDVVSVINSKAPAANPIFTGVATIPEVSGDIIISEGANRTIKVARATSQETGYNLTIEAGTYKSGAETGGGDLILKGGNGDPGDADGGDVVLQPGTGQGSGSIVFKGSNFTFDNSSAFRNRINAYGNGSIIRTNDIRANSNAELTIIGRDNSSDNGSGYDISIRAGNSGSDGGNGGDITINAGSGETNNGNINIGTSNTDQINIGSITNVVSEINSKAPRANPIFTGIARFNKIEGTGSLFIIEADDSNSARIIKLKGNDSGDDVGGDAYVTGGNGDAGLGDVYIGTENTESVNIGSNNKTTTINGNVGIGTDTPSAKLDVSGDTNIDGTLTVDKITLSDNSFIVEAGDFTLGSTHRGATVLLQNTGPITITIPQLTAGHVTTFIAETINDVTFQTGSGLSGLNSFNGANTMLGQFAQAQIIFKTPEYAFLGGQIT